MKSYGRRIAPAYLHQRAGDKPVPSCECDKCLQRATQERGDHMAAVFGLAENDLEQNRKPQS